MKKMARFFLRAFGVLLAALAALLVAAAAVGATYEPNTEIPKGLLGSQVTVRHVPLRVVQRGAGRDVLLIHGSPGSVEDWAPVMDALSGSFRVTAFDRPGQGFSGDTDDHSFEANATIALALIDELKLEHVVVVGHSYGGSTALAMALRDSPTVDAYVVVDSAAYKPSRKPDPILRMLDLPVVGLGFGALVGPVVASKKIRSGLVEQFRAHAPSPDFVRLRIAIWSSPKVTHAIAAETLTAAAGLAALSPRYPGIRHPVYIVAEADDAFRRATAERLHHDVAGSTLELVPGTGHYIQFENTDAVVGMIQRAALEHAIGSR
jgi:pimeloyl-ACP methyl ester carboxylesterase